ncbi:4'-phosphopantetheinyl transferase family protein [Alkalicoccobacillus murimartini]|uniref:4'-phosphopantetheinyl transferase n=1 Tax=Alkalicoccobacillus murimartini TaxID=171685 RepID=A0ABT9YKE1_9BACI|nr:4'-phosphopantetheinyl transferase superfamily protein [Alkalicoccobacillus murimartini]MDQ0208338.1 4'-phosphopantetheinyl transferase [Alkalicoccobacillus murimartini]
MTISIAYGKSENVINYLSGLNIKLNKGELENYNRMVFPDIRRDYLAAHLLSRYCINNLTSVDIHEIELNQHCASCGGKHGKPEVIYPVNTFVSWSHTRGYVACISAYKPVGIDIEKMDEALDVKFGESFLSKLEIEKISLTDNKEVSTNLYKMWVKKESLIKLGLYEIDQMREICLTSNNNFYFHDRKKYAFIDIDMNSNYFIGSAVYEIEKDVIEKVLLAHL